MFFARKLLLGMILLAMIVPSAAAADAGRPIVIGHRGASGYRPEHTLASYQLAIDQGADFIEPDLVLTKDGVLVARHENDITATTNVASRPEFASRKATKSIDGVPITGWFTEDFTLAELKTLRAIERLPQLRGTAFDGQFEVPTFQEVIDLAKRNGGVGIFPETKHPTYFKGIGLPFEQTLVDILNHNGYRNGDARVFIQSFEVWNLQLLNTMTSVKLVQLLDATGKPYDFVVSGDPRAYADLATPSGLDFINDYADGIGVNKNLIIPRDTNNKLLPPTTLVADAHAKGLIVHGWTFRRENTFLPADLRIGTNPAGIGDLAGEIRLFLSRGMDGFFTDNPDIGVAARNQSSPIANRVAQTVTPSQGVKPGDTVTFAVTIELKDAYKGVSVQDTLTNAGTTPGTQHVPGSAKLDGVAIANPTLTSSQNNRVVYNFALNDKGPGTFNLTYDVVIGASVECPSVVSNGVNLDVAGVNGHLATTSANFQLSC